MRRPFQPTHASRRVTVSANGAVHVNGLVASAAVAAARLRIDASRRASAGPHAGVPTLGQQASNPTREKHLLREPRAPGDAWLHEIKHDGFRVVARKDGDRVRLYSRPGNDLTYLFRLIVEAQGRVLKAGRWH